MRPSWRNLVILLLTASTACSGRSLEPEAVELDRMTCAACGMLISRLDHAAQAVYADAETRFYDDVGCLATDNEAMTGEHRFYVHTNGGQWTGVHDARFLLGSGALTPMGYDVVAFEEGKPNGTDVRLLSWDELRSTLERMR